MEKQGFVFSNVLTMSTTIEVVCYKEKTFKISPIRSKIVELKAESQFAQIIGRAWLYQNMPYKDRKELPQFPLSDSQVNLVVKDYYTDESFCRNNVGNINLWKLFNLFTGANKMS